MSFKNNVDDALAILGYGRWQIPFFVLSFLVHFLIPAQVVGSPVLSVPLPFRCFSSQTTPLEATIYVNTNTTTQQPPTVTYESRCGATEQNISLPPPPMFLKTDMPSCSFIEYDHSTFPSTIISEFHLVCERSSLRPLFQILVSIGSLCGAPFGGVISDKYGRKTILAVGCGLYAVSVVVMAVCPWYSVVLLCRFVVGLSISFMMLPSFSLAQETTPPRFRSHVGMLIGLGFSVGIVAFAGMAFLVRPWRYLMLTASSILIVIIPLACWVEESPRWLAQKGRHKEAVDIFQRGARRNRIPITSELIAIFENLKAENSKCNVVIEEKDKEVVPRLGLRKCLGQCRNYLRYPGLRRILLVTSFIWYLQTVLYLGIMLNANNFTSNDPFVYVVMSGIMDFTAIVLITPVTVRVGRRFLSGMLYLIAGILLLLDIAIPAELNWLKWVFIMTAFLLSSACYQVQFIYTPELFPTVIRSRGFGLVNGMGSLGWITAPLVTDLLVQKIWWAVNVVCGLAGLLASILIIFLPETRNLPLPETLQDVETRRLGNKGKKDSGVVKEQFILDATTPQKTDPLLNIESENSNFDIKEH